MMGIQKVVAGSRNRKREKRMNATTYAKTRNVLVREIQMPVVFCKDCKYYGYEGMRYCTRVMDEYRISFLMKEDDFCSRGERKDV